MSTGAGRLNGLISGGTFVEAFPHAGLTLTLVTPTQIMNDGALFDASGLTITLPNSDDTYYIYFDEDSASPTYQTLQAQTGAPPEIETAAGIENVMIAKVVVSGGGTTIDDYQDARFFVRNLDRKVEYTSVQGEDVDSWSEACFVTLDACMFWLEHYGSSASSEEQKGTILIRGTHNLNSTLTIPIDHVEFVGDGDAILSWKAAVGTMVDISGRSDVSFRNIKFETSIPYGASMYGVRATGTPVSNITFDDCVFTGTTNANYFHAGISLATDGSANCGSIYVRDSLVSGVTGIEIDAPKDSLIIGTKCVGAGAPGGSGINFTSTGAAIPTDTSITSTNTDNCTIGVQVVQASNVKITGCSVRNATTGILIDNDASRDVIISDTLVQLEDSTGMTGIQLYGERHSVSNCDISNLRTTGGYNPGDEPTGIDVPTGMLISVSDTRIRNFINTQTPGASLGYSINFQGMGGSSWESCTVSNCDLEDNGIEVASSSVRFQVSNCDIKGHFGNGVSARPLIKIGDGAKATSIVGNSLDCNEAATHGIHFDGGDNYGNNILVDANQIVAFPDYGILFVNRWRDWTISNNKLDGLLNSETGTAGCISGEGIRITAASNMVPHEGAISNNNVTRCVEGIVVHGFNITPVTVGSALIDTVSITGNRINYCARNTAATAIDPLVVWNTGGGLPPGACGIAVGNARNIVIANNQISSLGVVLDGTVRLLDAAAPAQSTGIFVRNVGSLSVQNNKVSDIFATDGGDASKFVFARPIRIEAAFAGVGNGGAYTMENLQITGNACIGTGAAPAYGQALTDTGIGLLSSNIADDANATYGILRANISDNQVTKMSINAAHAALVSTTTDLWHTAPAQGIVLFQEGKGACKEVQFNNNTVYDIDGYGIRTYANGLVSYEAEMANISITSNQLNAVGSALFQSAGIYSLINSGAAGYGLNILNNSIGSAISYGIYILAEADAAAAAKLLNTNVQGNAIQRVDDGLTPDRRGIAIHGAKTAALIQHANVQGNVIGAQLSGVDSATVDVGIDILNQYTNSWKDIVVVDNKIISGNVDRDNYAIRVTANVGAASLGGAIYEIDGVTIRNNTSLIHADHAGGSYGVFVESDGFVWDGLRVDSNVVRYEVAAGNILQRGVDCRFKMTVSTAAPTDTHRKVSVDGNDITCTGTNGGAVSDIRTLFYGNVGVDELSVCGNKTRNNIAVLYDNAPALAASFGIENWSICNNQVNNSTMNATPLINCKVENVQASSFSASNVRICDNQLDFLPNAGVLSTGIYALFDSAGSVFTTENLQVSGNQLHDIDEAIYIHAPQSHLFSVVACGNNITDWGGNGGGASGGNAVRINVAGFADAITVSDNSIANGNTTANGAAIHYRHVGQQRTTGLQIANNNISVSGGQAVMVALGSGSAIQNQPDRAISVSGNTINQCSLGASNPVVFIMPDATNVNPGKIIAYQVSDNTISYCGPDDVPVDYIKVDVQLYDLAYGGVVSNNVVVGGVQGVLATSHLPRDGILVSIPDTGGSIGGRGLSVTGNSITGQTDAGGSNCGIEINCEGETHGLTVDTNTVHGYPPQGCIKVKVEDADLIAASISGNVVTVPPSQSGSYGIYLEQSNATASRLWRGVSVNNNTIEDIDGNAGISVGAGNCKVKDFNCNGNQLWQPGAYGIWLAQSSSSLYLQELIGFSCSDNQVVMDSGGSATATSGIRIDMLKLSGASAELGTSVYATNGRVSNNSVVFDNGTHSSTASGITIELFGSGNYTANMSARVWDVSNNIIRDFRSIGLTVNLNPFSPVNAGPTCGMTDWGISNNLIRTKTDDPAYVTGALGALYIRTEGATDIQHCNVTNNQVHIAGSDAMPATYNAFYWNMWNSVVTVANQICHNSITVPSASVNDQTVVLVGAPTFSASSGVCADNFANKQTAAGTGFAQAPWTSMNNHDNFEV